MKIIRIRYVRTNYDSAPIGCVVLLEDGSVGWSQCNSKDQFSKTKAKEIAAARAITGTNKQPALVTMWHRDEMTMSYSRIRMPLVQQAIYEMEQWRDGRPEFQVEEKPMLYLVQS